MDEVDIDLVSCGGTLYLVSRHNGSECWVEFQKSPLSSSKKKIGTVYTTKVKEVKRPVRRAKRK